MDGINLIAVSIDDTLQVIKELGGLVAGITALVIALTAWRKSGKAQDTAQSAKTDAAVANKSSELAQHRVDRVGDVQNTMRSDMTNVASNSIPAKMAEVLLNAQPLTGGNPAKVEIVGQVETHEESNKGSSETSKPAS